MQFDVVLPLYSPHEGWDRNIAEAVLHLREHFSSKNVKICVYLTNDGAPLSKYPQKSLDLIRQAADGNFHFLPYEKNRGKGYSLRFLVGQASGEYQVYTDGDFPFGWKSVANAFEQLESGADVVMGQRGSDYGGALCFSRKLISKAARLLNRMLLGLPDQYLDAQAGLKGFNPEGKKAFLSTTTDSFIFDTEFILIAWRRKLKIVPIPISIRPGLILSSMGMKIVRREFLQFIRILWRIRILHRH